MKVRIKFAKTGKMVYIGHLDLLRFFQKAMRRAHIDIKYSEGFSPHQIMSFAHPLGIGTESVGDYLDVELNSMESCDRLAAALNEAMVPGIEILAVAILPDKCRNAMSQVAAAAYHITMADGFPKSILQRAEAIMEEKELCIEKEGKNGVRTVDIRPFIYEINVEGNDIYCILDASSSNNVKPFNLIKLIYAMENLTIEPWELKIRRLETYMDAEEATGACEPILGRFVPLACGMGN